MQISIQKIATILRAEMLQSAAEKMQVRHLLFDSRQVSHTTDGLFFAIVGQRNDGHRYLENLYRVGVRNFVVSKHIDLSLLPEANIFKVKDTLTALQDLAKWHRGQFQIPVIGITGSNGKTIVKTWLSQLLRLKYRVVANPKSYNSQIGVPVSVWQIQAQHQLGIFEAGISRPNEMTRLAEIIQPSIGVFTNIGTAHREGFATQQVKIEEKLRLFSSSKTLIYCADHHKIANAVREKLNIIQTFTWSATGLPANVQIIDFQTIGQVSTKIIYLFQGKKSTFTIPFTDAASIENVCHCLTAMLLLQVPPSQIRRRMAQLEPLAMRLEMKAAINQCSLINDAYSNDLSSLGIALAFARSQVRDRRLTLVLSDILQSGLAPEVLYQKVADVVLAQKVNRLIGVGNAIKSIQPFLNGEVEMRFFANTHDFLEKIYEIGFSDELILLKGARAFAFERLARRLEKKAHKTVLEVNLNALVSNLNMYEKLLSPGVKILAMVKAAAYGSGAAEVAKLLEFHKVDYLGVAYLDEGIELRQAGVQLPILVLNPNINNEGSLESFLRYHLEPEVYSLGGLTDLLHFLGKKTKIGIHLKLDTGMHRLGFELSDLPNLLEKLVQHPNVTVKSVLSHLAASDTPEHDTFTAQQAELFTKMYAAIEQAMGYSPIRHLCNTGGIARFPAYHFDMVRLGIGLYGVQTTGLPNALCVVNTLKATISQIKEIAPGDTVGYNRFGKINAPTRIATISIGYADGLLRLAGNGNFEVLIRGKKAPTIGNICMDMSMIDVTHIPEAREGDEVIIFGENPPVEKLAAALKTIPYEVFTNISERVKRVYFQE